MKKYFLSLAGAVVIAAGVWLYVDTRPTTNSVFETKIWGFAKTHNAAGEEIDMTTAVLAPGANICVFVQGWSKYKPLSWARNEVAKGAIAPDDGSCLTEATYPLADRGADWHPFHQTFRYTAPMDAKPGEVITITSRLRSEQEEGRKTFTITVQ